MDDHWVIAALYQFIKIADPKDLQHKLLTYGKSCGIVGTLILAYEGINGTVAGTREAIDGLKQLLAELGFQSLEYKESFAPKSKTLFYRMKVKIKKEIVTMRIPEILPNTQKGQYLSPREWHELIQRPDVIIIDTRNDYEYKIGTFKGAINPNIQYFRDFPAFLEAHREEWKDKIVAQFCTGGIRCEKSTSYATVHGIGKEVYHLKGGILKYLEEISESEGLWQGQCFVFDYRVSVGYGLTPGNYEQCYACRMPITPEEKQSPEFIQGISCPHCYGKTSVEQIARFAERQKQMELGYCQLGGV